MSNAQMIIARFSTPVARAKLERAALRSRSSALREVLARRASGGRGDYAALLERARGGSVVADASVAGWLGSLARVVAFQRQTPTDLEDALDLFRAIAPDRLDAASSLTYAQLLVELRQFDVFAERADELAAGSPDVDFVRLSLLNPALATPYEDEARWVAESSSALAGRGLTDVSLSFAADGGSFDTLYAERGVAVDGPLVSVVMTTYQPSVRLLASLRSVLSQTWENLEVLLVDDASGPEAADVLEQASELDPRVRVIRLEKNGGTYRARNAALSAARGHYVTGHDDDDWAHPVRIERQVAALEQTSGAEASLARAVWASEDLQIAPLGWPSTGRYAPSFLTRRATALRAGRYLEARKGADTEYIRRIEAMTGAVTVELGTPLSVYRTRAGSLSREDFAPGWDHPARISFWQRARVVHDEVRAGRILASDAPGRITAPSRLVDAMAARAYDVLFVGDWRGSGHGQSGLRLREALALRAHGMRVGIVQIDDLRRAGERLGPVDTNLIHQLNRRYLDEVFLDDEAVAHTVVVRDAGALAYADDRPSRIRARQVAVVVDGPPLESSPTRGTYSLVDSLARAERIFGITATVVGHDRASLQTIRSVLAEGDPRIAAEPYLGMVDRQFRNIERPERILGKPVVGMVVEHPFDIPTPEIVRQLFPASVDVRLLVLGDHSIEGLARTSLLYRAGDLELVDYLAQLDFVVDFAQRVAPSSTIHAALAAGCIVTARAERRAALGEAALYVLPAHAAALYDAMRRDGAAYSTQVARAQSFAREHLGESTWVRRASRLGIGATTSEIAPPLGGESA